MPTLLLRLAGPMQSWGTTSRFDQRDTGKEPSKSGVLGLLAAAMGIDREDAKGLEPLCQLVMAVRHDRPGIPRREYQTAGCHREETIIRANGAQANDGGVVSQRFYLADAAFLVGLEGKDKALLERADSALRNPHWPLSLGRKAYLPSDPPWVDGGVRVEGVEAVLRSFPWTGGNPFHLNSPKALLVSWETTDGAGTLRMDQPLGSFADRRFGSRSVRSEWIPCPGDLPCS